MKQDSVSKLTATQNVIRNKFEKAYTNRIVNEHDVNHAMKPLTASAVDLESENNGSSLHNHSKTTNNSEQLHLATKSYSNHSIKTNEEKHHDPNTLCDILRILLASPLNVDDMKSMQQINAILDELRKLEIII